MSLSRDHMDLRQDPSTDRRMFVVFFLLKASNCLCSRYPMFTALICLREKLLVISVDAKITRTRIEHNVELLRLLVLNPENFFLNDWLLWQCLKAQSSLLFPPPIVGGRRNRLMSFLKRISARWNVNSFVQNPVASQNLAVTTLAVFE